MKKILKKKPKKIICIIFLILLILILFIFNFLVIHKNIPKEVIIQFDQKDILVYKDIKINDLVKKTNIVLKNGNQTVNTNKVGKNKVELYFKYKSRNYLLEKEINIIDNIPPKLVVSSNKKLLVNSKYDFCANAFYGDNYDRKPRCKIEGKYDIKTPGEYKISLVVTDSSKNINKQNINLYVVSKFDDVVKEPIPEVNIDFASAIDKYKTDKTEIGIDVSRWQKDIDFAKVKSSGASFVMIRMGIQSGPKEIMTVDKSFETNYKNAKKNGLKVGVYVYTSAINKKTIRQQAKWTVKNLNKKHLDLPVVFDWENWSHWNEFNMNFHDINEISNTFIEVINNNGYKGMLYSSKNHLEHYWENINDYPVWLAHYTDKTSYKGKYDIWQLTDKGRIDGINGNVDIDVLYNK